MRRNRKTPASLRAKLPKDGTRRAVYLVLYRRLFRRRNPNYMTEYGRKYRAAYGSSKAK